MRNEQQPTSPVGPSAETLFHLEGNSGAQIDYLAGLNNRLGEKLDKAQGIISNTDRRVISEATGAHAEIQRLQRDQELKDRIGEARVDVQIAIAQGKLYAARAIYAELHPEDPYGIHREIEASEALDKAVIEKLGIPTQKNEIV